MSLSTREIPESTRQMLDNDRAFADAGVQLVDCRRGYAVVAMKVQERMLNGYGACHGGWLLFLSDAAFGCAANSHGTIGLSANSQVSFISSGQHGETLTAVCQLRHHYGRNGLYDITITGESGNLVAEARATARFRTDQILTGEGIAK
ncbi:PaaI family thioesterase [Rhodococcus sp. (in: high G+C Gram-positive bacteria)]|uniref:PaaI family thioesterase n=1 Tax=Rhodococcus sp. TaxID=1831 RepID=UPI003BB08CE1